MKRQLILAVFALTPGGGALASEAGQVWRAPSCQCCEAWANHMRAAGFDLTINDLPRSELDAKKSALGIPANFAGCHTAKIGKYVIEGHVPAEDVQKLIATGQDAIGLSVPGMPAGSPGMETGGESTPYDVMLIKADGTAEVFARHGGGAAGKAN